MECSLRPDADSGCFRLMRLFCTKGRRLWVLRAASSRLGRLRPPLQRSLSVTLVSGPSTLGQQTFVHDSPGHAPPPAHGGVSRLWCHSSVVSLAMQPKSPAFPAKPQFKAQKAGAAPRTPSDSPSYSDARQRPATAGSVSARAHVRHFSNPFFHVCDAWAGLW
jgi:hypothetical protein